MPKISSKKFLFYGAKKVQLKNFAQENAPYAA